MYDGDGILIIAFIAYSPVCQEICLVCKKASKPSMPCKRPKLLSL